MLDQHHRIHALRGSDPTMTQRKRCTAMPIRVHSVEAHPSALARIRARMAARSTARLPFPSGSRSGRRCTTPCCGPYSSRSRIFRIREAEGSRTSMFSMVGIDWFLFTASRAPASFFGKSITAVAPGLARSSSRSDSSPDSCCGSSPSVVRRGSRSGPGSV